MTFLSAETAISRALVTTADVPAERVEALRRAFDATMKDPQFLAEAKRLDLEVRPVAGPDVERLIKEIYASPLDVVKLAQQAEKARAD